MKSAEEMMLDYIQSQLDANQTFTINSEQYLSIWNWYQEVELAAKNLLSFIGDYDRIDMPDLYNDGRWQPLSLGMDGIDLPFAKWTGNEETMRYAKRVDGNHHEIIQGLRECGWTVKDTSRYGDGFPDCIVAGDCRVVMLEIKQGSAKLTDAEKEFHEMFHGLGVYVVRSLEDAIRIMEREKI